MKRKKSKEEKAHEKGIITYASPVVVFRAGLLHHSEQPESDASGRAGRSKDPSRRKILMVVGSGGGQPLLFSCPRRVPQPPYQCTSLTIFLPLARFGSRGWLKAEPHRLWGSG